MRKGRNWAPEELWRWPAGLSTAAALALSAWPFLDRHASGTFARETLAFVLAVGACAMFLGLGLGVWLAIRLRTRATLVAGLWSLLVALAWWLWVFGPMVGSSGG